ncbi:MAG: Hsp20/alpha crystallin family protein [Betaproteobacteria bacterium]|nr:MAG: Hsp20/alpha crystallin family protein [Betaproteobacteria bacterium]
MRLEDLKQGFTSLWDSVSEGWQRLRQSAAGALIRFMPGEGSNLPAKAEVDDDFYLPSHGWALLGGDVFEDERRLVVRVEVPGMKKDEIKIEVLDDALVVSGEKRFERESSEGRYRVLQCAYGSFRRVIPLPARVLPDQANARYADGVLKIELPKAFPGKPQGHTIQVS